MSWVRFALRRTVQAVLAVTGLIVVTFLLLRLAPGDPAQLLAGPRATEADIAALRHDMGLDRSLPVQLVDYAGNLLSGDLGENVKGSNTVTGILSESFTPTLMLVVGGMALAILLASVLAVGSVIWRGGVLEKLVRAYSMSAVALPPFWIGLMFLLLIAVPTGAFPVGGWAPDLAGQLRALVLPVVTLAITTAPLIVRSLRSSLLQVLGSEYVDAGRAVGLTGWPLLRHYVFRNAATATVPLVAVLLTNVLAGSVIIEATFGLPGLGSVMKQSVMNRDFNVVQGVVLLVGVIIILVHGFSDALVAVLDPRVRL